MSLEFNRRSFLKYSAAAAVAVAGSSLLVGCGEDEYQKTGKIGSTLKLMGTFKLYDGTGSAPAAPVYTRSFHRCSRHLRQRCVQPEHQVYHQKGSPLRE